MNFDMRLVEENLCFISESEPIVINMLKNAGEARRA